jgi:hypothetical protein
MLPSSELALCKAPSIPPGEDELCMSDRALASQFDEALPLRRLDELLLATLI